MVQAVGACFAIDSHVECNLTTGYGGFGGGAAESRTVRSYFRYKLISPHRPRIANKLLFFIIFFAAVAGLTMFHPPVVGAGMVPAERSYKEVKGRYNRFMADRKQWGVRRSWEKLARDFDTLARRYPGSKRADDALYLAGGLYLSLYNYSGWASDLQQAARRYKMLLKNYSSSRLADDALFNLGVVALKSHDKLKAKKYWQRLLRDYPKSDMRERAEAALKDIATPASYRQRRDGKNSAPPRKRPRVTKAGYRRKYGRKQELNPNSRSHRQKGKKGRLTRVLDLRHWSSPTYTRLVIDLSHEADFSKGILKDKHNSKKTKSIYINLKDCYIPEVSRELPINDGILQRVKVSQFNSHTVRAVIHVADIDHYKIFALSHPPRIVIDVIGGGYRKARRRYRKPASQSGGRKNAPTLSLAQQLGLGVGTIVIDAGHGGKDPGALSPGGGREKDVVLDISRRLSKILQQRLKCRVIMTRKRDCFIPLEERTVIANTRKADLFVSIHANASRNRRAHGVATYFLNLSTDREAMELAALENSTSTKNIGQLQSILNDLMQNSKIKESSRLASCVQRSLVAKLRKNYKNVKNLGVKQAPFYVLIGAQMPSVLVEVSFISNKMESRRLATAAYRQSIAEGLADGIQRYVEDIKLSGN